MSESPLKFLDQGFGRYTEEEMMDRLLEAAQYSDEHYRFVDREAQDLAMVLRRKIDLCGGQENALFNRALIDKYVDTERTVRGKVVHTQSVEKECVDKGVCQQRDGVWLPWSINWKDSRYTEPACYLNEQWFAMDFLESFTRSFRIEYYQGYWLLKPFGRVGDTPLFSLTAYSYEPGYNTGILPAINTLFPNSDVVEDMKRGAAGTASNLEYGGYDADWLFRRGISLNNQHTRKSAQDIEDLIVSAQGGSAFAVAELCDIIQKELKRKWGNYFKEGAHRVHLDNWRLQDTLSKSISVSQVLDGRSFRSRGYSLRSTAPTLVESPDIYVYAPAGDALFNREEKRHKTLVFRVTEYFWKSNSEIQDVSNGRFRDHQAVRN